MMTSVVACGNGWLSGGLYRSLASEARLVLVKCGHVRRVRHDDIRRGLEWVAANRARFDIRIVNVSVGGDYEASYLTDPLSTAAESLARAGVLVCAAVGNAGHLPGHPVMPPASAPSVLAVGGVDDKNQLAFDYYARRRRKSRERKPPRWRSTSRRRLPAARRRISERRRRRPTLPRGPPRATLGSAGV